LVSVKAGLSGPLSKRPFGFYLHRSNVFLKFEKYRTEAENPTGKYCSHAQSARGGDALLSF
jgi:hypothetical protein